jgi:subtilisin family serine protease
MKTNARKFSWLLGALALASVGATAQDAPRPDATDASQKAAQATLMPADADGRYSYMIEFAEPELLRHPSRQAGQSINLQSPEMQAARTELKSIQASRVSEMTSRLGRSVEPTHHYLATENGIAVRLTQEEARIVADLEGVKNIERARQYRLNTYRGPSFMGADTIWDGTNVPDGSPLLGEGMIAAILDSGIPDPNNHDSFANVASCGHGGANPDKVLSALDCSSTDGDGLCNGGSPFDTDGHGSHTASTVAGNTVDSGSSPAPDLPGGFSELSGVAPCAHIRSYKVCPGQSCPGPDIAAGLESVLLQGEDSGGLGHADVMNYSISGGSSPWSDFDRDKLDIVDAGVFIAASAGNTSQTTPDPVGQVNHRGPWVMSVAASTHDTIEGFEVALDGGPTGAGIEGTGPALGSTYVGDLRYAGDVDAANFEGCSAFAANAFDGEAALISRGSCSFADKVNNAVAAGANFVIVFNNIPGVPIVMGGLESTSVSSVMVSNSVGLDMVSTLGGGTAQVTVDPTSQGFSDPAYGDILADFSFRGPTPEPLQDLQKPDITAPGVNILAAVPGGYGFISGTSMSSPHAAGAAVLVRQANPDWTASEVKSALQMTAVKTGVKDDGTTAWDWDDVGSGRVDLTGAALAGLVMDETVANYLAADPAAGGDVKTLNVPSMRNLSCTTECTWQRTVRNTLDTPSDWTVTTASTNPDLDIQVSPSSFSFGGGTGETQTLTITAAPQADLTSVIAFGEVVMSEDAAQAPDAHMTVAISGTNVAPQNIEIAPSSISTTLDAGTQSSEQLDISNTGDLDLTWSIEYNQSAASVRGGTSVFWDQPTDGTSGIISDVLQTATQGDIPVYSANDFVLAPPQQIESIFTPGFWNGGDVSTANTINWYVYADDGGQPAGEPGDGSAVWSYSAAPGSTGITISDNNITLDVLAATGSPITLPETGRYWLVVAPSITTPDDPSSWWNWSQGIAREATNHLYDPTDFFGAGATSWTPQTDLGVAWPDSAFTLSGTLDCTGTAPGWLSLSTESGTIPGGDSTQVTLDFDATGLQVGDYEAFLCLSSNDPDNSLQFVPVNMTVTDPFEIFSDRFEQ